MALQLSSSVSDSAYNGRQYQDNAMASPAIKLQLLPPQLPKPPPPPPLTVSITEQPARFYRFRYPSELEGSRVGGLLLGRSANNDSKSYMKLQISGIDPTVHSSLQLTVCTVSPDRAPHPYWLHGDNCRDGFYKETKTVDSQSFSRSHSTVDFIFTRLAAICVPKKSNQDIRRAMETRLQKVPALPDYTGGSPVQYEARSLGKIRLAFSASFMDTNGLSWFCPTVYSDEILDEKQKIDLSILCLNPAEVPLDGGSIVAAYTSYPITGLQRDSVDFVFTVIDEKSDVQTDVICDVEEIKKHLLTVRTPSMRYNSSSERVQCQLSIRYGDIRSNRLNIVFCGTLPAKGGRVAGKMMKRPAYD